MHRCQFFLSTPIPPERWGSDLSSPPLCGEGGMQLGSLHRCKYQGLERMEVTQIPVGLWETWPGNQGTNVWSSSSRIYFPL